MLCLRVSLTPVGYAKGPSSNLQGVLPWHIQQEGRGGGDTCVTLDTVAKILHDYDTILLYARIHVVIIARGRASGQ